MCQLNFTIQQSSTALNSYCLSYITYLTRIPNPATGVNVPFDNLQRLFSRVRRDQHRRAIDFHGLPFLRRLVERCTAEGHGPGFDVGFDGFEVLATGISAEVLKGVDGVVEEGDERMGGVKGARRSIDYSR